MVIPAESHAVQIGSSNYSTYWPLTSSKSCFQGCLITLEATQQKCLALKTDFYSSVLHEFHETHHSVTCYFIKKKDSK